MIEQLKAEENIYGTSFFNDCIYYSVNQLKKYLGSPQYCFNNGIDKTNVEWNLKINGNIFSLYDWKEYRIIDMDEKIEWHIGASSREISNKVFNDLSDLIQE